MSCHKTRNPLTIISLGATGGAVLDLSVFLLTNEAFELLDWFGNFRKVVHDREAFLGSDDSDSAITHPV